MSLRFGKEVQEVSRRGAVTNLSNSSGWYEHKTDPPLSTREFLSRLARHGGYALILAGISLLLGIFGYHWIAGMSWVDSFLNSSMLLGGMGPVGNIDNAAGKIFAGVFALYSGVVFLFVTAILMAPIFHRVLHKFHWETRSERD